MEIPLNDFASRLGAWLEMELKIKGRGWVRFLSCIERAATKDHQLTKNNMKNNATEIALTVNDNTDSRNKR